MIRKIIFLLFIAISCYSVQAQTSSSLSGKIIDSIFKKPVEYATVTLSTTRGNLVLNGATTDSLGNFKMTGISSGMYNLKFESINYASKLIDSLNITAGNKPLSLGKIMLFRTENTLQTVVVTAQAKLIDNRIDKLVFNAENDISSQGGVATDVLKKVPQVTVDADGNVQLAGASGVRFLIDGKPSTIFGNNITDVLQSIPASEIKSIEVITNPGAKYDAEGTGGIINIILKKVQVNGINSNLSLTAGTRQENGSFNITIRHGSFGVHAFVSGNDRLYAGTPTALSRTTTDTAAKAYSYFNQQSKPRTNHYGGQGGLGFDWTINKHNSVSANANYNRFGGGGSGLVNQSQQYVPFNTDSISSETNTLNNSGYRWLYYSTDINFNYRKTFAKEDESLELNANTSLGRNVSRSNTDQTLLPQDSIFYGVNNNSFGKENETEISLDYSNPFTKKIVFDAGTRVTLYNIKSTSNVLALQPDTKLYAYDPSVSNYLNYKQNVYAAYTEISFPVGKLFDMKTGARYERTQLNAYFSDAAQQANLPDYNTFVPSMYILRKLAEHQTLKLSYSKRIGRPEYDDLNPFINTTDPKNISEGNPYLRPEVGNRIELAYNHDYGSSGSFMISAFYRESNHDIQPYTYFYNSYKVGDSVYNNVSLNTTENIGLEQNLGVNLYGELKATDKLNLRSNIFFFRRHIKNGIDTGSNRTSYNYRINLNATYRFTKNLIAEFFGNFNSPRNEVQGRYPSFTTYTFAIRRQFWNKKGSLALTANNIFNDYVGQRTILYGTNFTTDNFRKIPFRSVGLNFTWKFGKLDFKKDKEDNNDEAPSHDEGAAQ